MPIPLPESGLVVPYSYLWHAEHRRGLDEGWKVRPCVIALSVERRSGEAPTVIVLPVTHSPPDVPTDALEIPTLVKRHLGLDDARSWIMLDEGNVFAWPGYDLRRVPETDLHAYGFLPPRFFTRVLAAFANLRRAGRGRLTPRD